MLTMNVSAYDVMYYNAARELCVERVWGSTPELCEKLIRNKYADTDIEIYDVHLCEGEDAETKTVEVG